MTTTASSTSISPKKIRVIGVPLDLGQSRRGVDMGPSAVRVAGLEARLEALGHEVEDGGNVSVAMPEQKKEGDTHAKYLKEITATCTKHAELVLKTLEAGKIRAEGLGEVQEMIDICDFAVGLSRQLYGLTMVSERPQHRMFEQWHPLGPVGVITAFNFPVAVWAWNAAIAAACGNTVVWKPSTETPLSSIAVQKICDRVMAANGLSGVFTLCIGDAEPIGSAMTSDPRLPLISATGSCAMGRHVARAVSGLQSSLTRIEGAAGPVRF
jgi:acyl-CoA reductase-like NAD-dependent aldehyde dehydrogenase